MHLRRELRWAWRRLRAFALGVLEFRSAFTTNPGAPLMRSYDRGREFAHRVTFRLFEE